jgi:restriction endonuclease S subunit
LVRIGDISEDGKLTTNQFDQIDPVESVGADLLLRNGDVLFPNRGGRTSACVFDLTFQDALAGAQFFILRPNPRFLRSDYLAWYLRSDEAARHFDERRTGTHVKIIQRNALTELKIPLPSLDVQETIVRIFNLQLSERSMTQHIAELKTKLLNYQLIQTAKKSSNPLSR